MKGNPWKVLKLKNRITKVKISLGEFNSRMEMKGEKVSQLTWEQQFKLPWTAHQRIRKTEGIERTSCISILLFIHFQERITQEWP